MVEETTQSVLRADAIRAYYELIGPTLERLFGGIPMVATAYPEGTNKPAVFVAHPKLQPKTKMRHVDIPTPRGTHHYYTLSRPSIDWFVDDGAVEFFGWSPTTADPTKAAFGRILIEPHGRAGELQLPDACRALLQTINKHEVDGLIVLSGVAGAQIWIPFTGAPAYPDLRAWLHGVVQAAATEHGDLFSLAAKAERGDRFYLSVSTNAVGRLSSLPYSLRATEALAVVTPIRVSDLGIVVNGDVTAANIENYLDRNGAIFAAEVARIGSQALPAAPRSFVTTIIDAREKEPRGYVIAAAVQLLADGKPRTADELRDAGVKQGLLTNSTTRKYVYHSLVGYISRMIVRGRAPAIVQNPDRRFRLNHPVDDWPQLTPPPSSPSSEVKKLVERLTTTSRGGDPVAFERAVCAAFDMLGFMATHVGGFAAPDGYIDAPLSSLAYRVMLECKTAKPNGVVNDANAPEAAKFREQYKAGYCVLIGPAFREETQIDNELRVHDVSLWTVDDLAKALENECDPYELRPAFEAGRAADKLSEIVWSRAHGEGNRVRVACAFVAEEGWKAQEMAAREVAPSEAPALTVDAAMLMLDERLERDGCAQGCTRAEVEAAFAWLTNPRVAIAARVEGAVEAIVIRRTGEG